MTPLVAFYSTWRLALYLPVALVFVILGLWMIGLLGDIPNPRHAPTSIIVLWGIVTTAFGGWGGFKIFQRMFDPRRQLRIDQCGLHWLPWSDATIPWTAIADVTVWKYKVQSFIVLHLSNPAHFPRRSPNLLDAANRSLTGGDIVISFVGLDSGAQKALDAIQSFREHTSR